MPPSTAAPEGTVLVIDEPASARVLATALRGRGYAVQVATTANAGLQLASAIDPDVMIVDLGLADLGGIEVCRRLRRWTKNPIVALSFEGGEGFKVEALDAGADDFVVKPFSMPELLARVRVAMRHRRDLGKVAEPDVVVVGPLTVDAAAHSATLDGDALILTRKEFALLAMLARNEGRVTPHRTLLAGIWGSQTANIGRLRTHVNQVRRKIHDEPGSPLHIENEPGVGYRLVLGEPSA